MKEKAKKSIDVKDLTSSPFFVIGIMTVICIAITTLIVLIMMDVEKTKVEITKANQIYYDNLNKVSHLKELKVKSEKAEKELEACKDILPDSLGDVYELQEGVVAKCGAFGLSVVSIDHTTVTAATQEVVFNIAVSGSFESIYDFMNYYSNLEQVHRFDSIALTRGADGTYSATLSLAILSEQGVTSVYSPAVDSTEQAQ